MGKKRIIRKAGSNLDQGLRSRQLNRGVRRKLDKVVLHIEATFNNTKAVLTDTSGNAVAWTSSGSLGFSGAKKGTPFAAAKVGEVLADKATQTGAKEAEVVIRGIGAGRESALRSFAAKGIQITRIADETPHAHNGPRAPKPRRV